MVVGGWAVIHHGYLVLGQIEDVLIPFASPELLLRMKDSTHREKDIPDRAFLRRLIENRSRPS
jgi:hypothetical protein